MIVLGIDPGVSGAWAVYDTTTATIFAADAPTVGKDLDAASFAAEILKWRPDRAVIERVGSMPNQGLSSTFRFGVAYGVVQGIVAAQFIPVQFVTPGKWKSHYGLSSVLPPGSARKKDLKEMSRARALHLWPARADLFKRKKDDGRAEAALLAKYGADLAFLACG